MMSIAEIVALWTSPEALANSIGAKADTVRKWRARGSIPIRWWPQIVSAARRAGIKGVSLETLAKAHLASATDRAA